MNWTNTACKSSRKRLILCLASVLLLLSLLLSGCGRDFREAAGSEDARRTESAFQESFGGFFGGLQEKLDRAAYSLAEKIYGTLPEDGSGSGSSEGSGSSGGSDIGGSFYGEEAIVIEVDEEEEAQEEGNAPAPGGGRVSEWSEEAGTSSGEFSGAAGEGRYWSSSTSRITANEQNYCFSTLPVDEKKLYMEIYDCIDQMQEDRVLSVADTAPVERVFNYVMMDHPELFYVSGYRIVQTTRGGVPVRLSITGKYTCTPAERAVKEKRIQAAADAVLKGMPEGGSEYEKVKYFYEWVIQHTEYSLSAPDDQNIASVFLNGVSVCQGYTLSMKYLLDRAGIFCTVVYGKTEEENHSWNLVRMDGTYCFVDATWGDTSYRDPDESLHSTVNYSYFGCSRSILERTHIIDTPAPIPGCDSLDAYYYVREDRYFTTPDLGRLRLICDEERTLGSHIFSVRCSDESVYNALMEALFDRREIFDIMQGESQIRYIRNDREYTLSFSI